MEKKFSETIYKNAPRERVEELLRFRSTHQIHRRLIDDVEWSYILSGEGSETILIMGGLTSTADAAHSTIMKLEKDYRVLAPSYPLYADMGEFVDGLIKLLDLEGIGRIHFIGTSLGAGVGHILVRRHPDRVDKLIVDKLILSAFGIYKEKKLKQTKQFINLFRFLPYWIISEYYQRIIPKLLAGLFHSKQRFKEVETLPRLALGLSHVN
jgi:pimeloyl-ACP methyl ester carboxylesterase